MSYRGLLSSASAELVINKSRFIAFAAPVESAEGAGEYLESIRRKYKDATHVCYAYIADIAGNERRFSDAGEPSGTAGQPILEVLSKRGLRRSVIAVVRYFGGVKLGAGGLVRAYSQAAAAAVASAGEGDFERLYSVRAVFTYAEFAALTGDYTAVLSATDYGERVAAVFSVPDTEAFCARLRQEHGKEGEIIGDGWFPVKR